MTGPALTPFLLSTVDELLGGKALAASILNLAYRPLQRTVTVIMLFISRVTLAESWRLRLYLYKNTNLKIDITLFLSA